MFIDLADIGKSVKEMNLVDYMILIKNKVKKCINFQFMDDLKTSHLEKLVDAFITNLETIIKKDENFTESNLNTTRLNRIFIENFTIFLANLICSFTDLLCYFYLDPFNYLNLEFYCDEERYKKIAEKTNYSLQLKITSNYKICNTDKNTTKQNLEEYSTKIYDSVSDTWKIMKEVNEKNQTPFEYINEQDVSYFPPYMKYDPKLDKFYRRYNSIDIYHDCEYTLTSQEKQQQNNSPQEQEDNKPLLDDTFNVPMNKENCQEKCSMFRTLDKLRLIYSALRSLIDIDYLKTNKFFYNLRVIRNNADYEELFNKSDFIGNFLNPFDNSISNKQNNHFIKNFLGEKVGFYFLFISNYQTWLLVPSIIGIVLLALLILSSIFFNTDHETGEKKKNYRVPFREYFDIFYTFVIILWGCIYIRIWSNKQKYYNYIWGMNDYESENTECPGSKSKKLLIFQGVRIPIINSFKSFLKRMLTILISLSMMLLTIACNILLFYLSHITVFDQDTKMLDLEKLINLGENTPTSNNEVKSKFWYYVIPIGSVIIRNVLSAINYQVANWSCEFENHIHVEQFENSFILKVTMFEFVNYYFNLFYIGYFKHLYGTCANNDCFNELGHQLVMILITSNILNLLEIGIPFITRLFKVGYFKYFISENLKSKFDEKDPRVTSNYKTNYDDTISYEYLEIIFNYGYIILFGITSPVCFVLAFLHIYLERIVDSYKLIKLHNLTVLDGGHGIGVILKILKIFTFLGIITNTTLSFFAMGFSNSKYKWPLLFLIVNVLIFILLSFKYNSNPFWFDYLEQIKYNSIRRVLDVIHMGEPKSPMKGKNLYKAVLNKQDKKSNENN